MNLLICYWIYILVAIGAGLLAHASSLALGTSVGLFAVALVGLFDQLISAIKEHK